MTAAVAAFTSGFSAPFYSGAGVVSDSGQAWPASLGEYGYMIDRQAEWSHRSIELLRPQADTAQNVGSQTLNPEAFWRRTFESWHVGAGQTHFDREEVSNPWRFRRSQGVDVWDRYQISLLNDVDAKSFAAETNWKLVVAGNYLYLANGEDVQYTTDVDPDTPSFTTLTGDPGGVDISDIASDGYNVLTAYGASGIYKTTRGSASQASCITGTVDRVAYGKGRWIASNDNVLYDVTTLVAGGGALPTALYTHPNTDFAWNSFAEGPTAFYVGGYSGDKSLIYRLTIKEDGTGLNQPVVAGFLPDGELIQCMYGYLGFVLVGTSKGVRVGVVGGNGDLTIGALIPTDTSVLCFEGQDKYVWYGLGNFEGNAYTGLGRIDLETFSNTESLAPAYASDLLSANFGNTRSVVTFQDRRVFIVNQGTACVLYAEDPDVLVSSGQVDSGYFDYGLSDRKLGLFVDVSFLDPGGTVDVGVSVDRATVVNIGTLTSSNSLGTGEVFGNEFEVRMTLNRDGSDSSIGPTLRTWAFRAQSATPVTPEIVVPFLIGPGVGQVTGFVARGDTVAQLENIEDLCNAKTIAVYREGIRSWSVIVADYVWQPREVFYNADEELGANGTCHVRMKVVN